ncbi:MAG: phytanoyl-CoA dioxygenase family protein [Candidatus Poribacteria bacterium]|nr:phytanoyl-CoA dioxygenase family protein [Candidatus Poribacteria bacterium]
MMATAEKTKLDQNGILLLEKLIDLDTTLQLRERSLELATEEQKAGNGHTYLKNDTAQRVWNLINKGEIFEEAIQHPKMLAAMEYLLGSDCTLSSFTVNILYPGAPDAGLHIDYPLSALPTPRPSFPIVANSVWFLDDFTLENGATSCIPGSHKRLEALPESSVEYSDKQQICGPRGSVLIVNGSIWHGSSENRTNSPRVALLGFFCRSILKPQQDHLKIVSDEVIERATPTLKRLLGLNSLPNLNT